MIALQPWEQRFMGKRWSDMPGSDEVARKLNFALWRRGLQIIVFDDDAKNGIRLKGSPTGRLPSLKSVKEKSMAGTREAKAKSLPAHMQRSYPLEEVLTLQEGVEKAARKAGMSLSKAAQMLGIRRTAFSRSEVTRSANKYVPHMVRFLEIMEERS